MKNNKRWWLAVYLACATPQAYSHHSGAMFDENNSLVISGKVREFQWANPHVYIQVVIKNTAGVDEEWSIELAAPMYLYNQGWRPNSLRAGDVITAIISPLRNGSKGGQGKEVLDKNGKPIGSKP